MSGKQGISIMGYDTVLGERRNSVSKSDAAQNSANLCFVIQNKNTNIFKCSSEKERDTFVNALKQFNTINM